jgi:hypothetical protein
MLAVDPSVDEPNWVVGFRNMFNGTSNNRERNYRISPVTWSIS